MAQDQGKSKLPRGKQHKPLKPSDNSIFEMLIRFDQDLKAVTTRLLWLLWVMSRNKYGYAILSERQLALLLHSNPVQIAHSIQIIVKEWGYFDHKRLKGVHRPWRFKLRKRRGEEDLDVKLRMWADRRVDAVVKLHWKASDETVEIGVAQFPCAELHISEKTMRRARKVMRELGHFTVESGSGGRSNAATYTRIQPTEVESEHMERLVELVRALPAKAKILAQGQGRMTAESAAVEEPPVKQVKQSKREPDMEAVRRNQLDAQFQREEEQRQRAAQHDARMAHDLGLVRNIDGTWRPYVGRRYPPLKRRR